ncbi:MAG: ABC transporter permease [Prosthecobacter sp.]|uniref:ABC transporter permease n=1 Tax=Prosthecobacter sp. TaxID=1965333 RepID=UPI0025EE7972|nr:ABC transporter permease [Prosthecobacter sp.]MCF7787407.1 ABC transporter permease [Prosthecobacter sp.]
MPEAAAPASIARPDGWQILKRNRAALIALGFLAGLSLIAIVVPMLLPEELKGTSSASFVPPLQRSVETHALHLLGTDVNGQDMLYRVLSGARVSLGVGLIGALISLGIGTLYGMISGYAGGRIDGVMMRTVEVLQSVPRILFIMILIAALDEYVKEWIDGWRLAAEARNWIDLAANISELKAYSKVLVMIVSLGLVEWLTMARIVRGQVLVLREMTFVTASRAMGQSSWGVLRRHLLPNLSTIILTYLTLTIPAVILDESFLSFLGLGIEDPAASWGSLLKDGAQVINPLESKWWLLVFPALLMSASLLALNFLGDGLRDAFDPKSGD